MGAAQTREYVDRRYEDHDVSELPDAPAAHHQRERAAEQALTRSEEELQVGTRRVPRGEEQIAVDQPDGER